MDRHAFVTDVEGIILASISPQSMCRFRILNCDCLKKGGCTLTITTQKRLLCMLGRAFIKNVQLNVSAYYEFARDVLHILMGFALYLAPSFSHQLTRPRHI